MSTTVTPPAGEQATTTFDAGEFIRKQNEREAAKRASAGKPAEKTETKTETKTPPAAPPAAAQPGDGGGVNRSTRRELNSLREEVGRLNGVIETLKELGAAPKPGDTKVETKPEEDPEPKRADFADENQYQRAMGKWEARQEAKKVLAGRDAKDQKTQQFEAFRGKVQEMQTKAKTDIEEYFADWDAVKAAAKEATDGPTFVAEQHPQLMALLALSDVQAGLYYHFAKEPAELERLLQLTKDPEAQIRSFHRLEGRIERLYYTDERKKKTAAAPEAGQPKAGEARTPEKGKTRGSEARNAELPAPSEAASARGGSTPSTEVKPILENGKVNPAWLARRNERDHQRR